MKITGFNPLIVTKVAESATALLEAHGFKAMEDSNSLTRASKSVLMVSPTGFAIATVKHIEDHD